MNEDPIPQAARLGPVYQEWECERCGVVDETAVAVAEDGEAWHAGWGHCGAPCHPVELLVNDPRRWANEGIWRLSALATLAETHTTPAPYRRMATQALRGDGLKPGRSHPEGGD